MPGQSAKGNPSGKRMSNPRRKTRREQCWLRGEQRKAARRDASHAAFIGNKKLRAEGKPTLWEVAKRERHARRHPLQSQHA